MSAPIRIACTRIWQLRSHSYGISALLQQICSDWSCLIGTGRPSRLGLMSDSFETRSARTSLHMSLCPEGSLSDCVQVQTARHVHGPFVAGQCWLATDCNFVTDGRHLTPSLRAARSVPGYQDTEGHPGGQYGLTIHPENPYVKPIYRQSHLSLWVVYYPNFSRQRLHMSTCMIARQKAVSGWVGWDLGNWLIERLVSWAPYGPQWSSSVDIGRYNTRQRVCPASSCGTVVVPAHGKL